MQQVQYMITYWFTVKVNLEILSWSNLLSLNYTFIIFKED